jgi:hypothetical protein
MERKYLLVLGLALVVSTGGVLAGRSPVAHKGQQWEYGVFELGQEWIWCAPGVLVRTESQRDFAVEMKLNTYGNPVGTLQVVNHLGEQGWELVEFSECPDISTYWFKRPR